MEVIFRETKSYFGMINLEKECDMIILSEHQTISGFDCGNTDLNEFFNQDAILYSRQMLSKTFFLRHKRNGAIVGAFSFSASSIKTADLPGSRRKKVKEYVPREKSFKSYPGILIGRLGIAKEFNGQGLGTQLIEIIKTYCLINFSEFVRFILVDAYNEPAVLNFYQKNEFITVFSTEEQEKESYRQPLSEKLQTRYMFYDMIHWRNKYEHLTE